MNVQVQRAAKPLDQSSRTGVSREICITRFPDQMRGNGASGIHIEPYEETFSAMNRIQGKLNSKVRFNQLKSDPF